DVRQPAPKEANPRRDAVRGRGEVQHTELPFASGDLVAAEERIEVQGTVGYLRRLRSAAADYDGRIARRGPGGIRARGVDDGARGGSPVVSEHEPFDRRPGRDLEIAEIDPLALAARRKLADDRREPRRPHEQRVREIRSQPVQLERSGSVGTRLDPVPR